MKDRSLLGPWIRRFLMEHLVAERNLSRNTQRSYRDTLRLLQPRLAAQTHTPVDALAIEELSADAVRSFLAAIEQEHGCTVTTRNQRLSAIHALARFVGERSPEHLAWCGEVRRVPFKRTGKNPLTYMEKAEIDALLAAPNLQNEQGQRDHALLLFLYNSGARASDNTVHLIILIALEILILGGGLRWRGRSGKLLILRLTPRGLRRLRLDTTRSSSISSRIAL